MCVRAIRPAHTLAFFSLEIELRSNTYRSSVAKEGVLAITQVVPTADGCFLLREVVYAVVVTEPGFCAAEHVTGKRTTATGPGRTLVSATGFH